MSLPTDYAQLLVDVKGQIQSAQLRAGFAVNRELLRLYWQVGQLLDTHQAVEGLFAMMKVADQQQIAQKYGVSDWKVFQSWLRSLSYLRNLVAHHSRLWNRNVVSQPKLPASGLIGWCDPFQPDLLAKPFLLLAICRHLVRQICPRTSWHQRLRAQIESFPAQQASKPRSIADMGTPANWESWW